MSGKVVLVTGASSGLGAATAERLAADGAILVLAARRRDKGEAVLAKARTAGGDGAFIAADVGDAATLDALFAEIDGRYGRLDAAVHCAGVTGPTLTPFADIDEAGWAATFATNVTATVMCMRREVPLMLRSGGGAIVNLSSIYGLRGSDLGHAPYCASKHAVIGLSKSAAIDYAAQGIRVNVVAPGFAHSEMVDPYMDAAPALMTQVLARHCAMNRLGESSEPAAAIAWLCSDEARFVNGAVLRVDGGETTRLY